MIRSEELLGLVDLLYEGATTGSLPAALRATAATFGGERGGLFVWDVRTHDLRELVPVEIEPAFQASYENLVTRRDMDHVWAERARLAAERSVVVEAHASRPEWRRTTFYEEWLLPQGIEQSLRTHVMPTPSTMAMLTLTRPAGERAFDDDAVAAMRMLQPHLLRAAQVRRGLEGVDLGQRQVLDVLDRLEHGVLLVDRRVRVRHASRAAEAILGDGLVTIAGMLACEHAEDTRALQRLVGEVTGAASLAATGGTLVVRRRDRRPLSVLVAPLRCDDPWLGGPPAQAIVIVTDPERPLRRHEAELRRLYGLTPAEARTVVTLLDAGGLADVARKLSVGLATVRTHLQRTFEKTGTHRQSELVRLMLGHRPPERAVMIRWGPLIAGRSASRQGPYASSIRMMCGPRFQLKGDPGLASPARYDLAQEAPPCAASSPSPCSPRRTSRRRPARDRRSADRGGLA